MWMYIDGRWVGLSSGVEFSAANPATVKEFGSVPKGAEEDVKEAPDAAATVSRS